MTVVTSGYYDERYFFEVSGHACAEENGGYRMPSIDFSENDGESALACAAASILVLTGAEEIEQLDSEGAFISSNITVEPGYACFELEVREEYSDKLKAIFDTLTLGFELLEENYPSCVSVK